MHNLILTESKKTKRTKGILEMAGAVLGGIIGFFIMGTLDGILFAAVIGYFAGKIIGLSLLRDVNDLLSIK